MKEKYLFFFVLFSLFLEHSRLLWQWIFFFTQHLLFQDWKTPWPNDLRHKKFDKFSKSTIAMVIAIFFVATLFFCVLHNSYLGIFFKKDYHYQWNVFFVTKCANNSLILKKKKTSFFPIKVENFKNYNFFNDISTYSLV